MDENIKKLLRELGTKINESISGSDEVNRQIQRIRDAGYEVYVNLDATVGLNNRNDSEDESTSDSRRGTAVAVIPMHEREVQFRINVNDLALLRALGIDPTRKVKTTRRAEAVGQSRDDD